MDNTSLTNKYITYAVQKCRDLVLLEFIKYILISFLEHVFRFFHNFLKFSFGGSLFSKQISDLCSPAMGGCFSSLIRTDQLQEHIFPSVEYLFFFFFTFICNQFTVVSDIMTSWASFSLYLLSVISKTVSV